VSKKRASPFPVVVGPKKYRQTVMAKTVNRKPATYVQKGSRMVSGFFKSASKSINKGGFNSYANVYGGGGRRSSTVYKKKRLTRRGKRYMKRWKKFSKKVCKVQYNNLGTKQIAWNNNFVIDIGSNAVLMTAISVMGNSSADGAGSAVVVPFEDDIRRILVSAGLEPSEGYPTTANKAIQQMFLKGIGCDLRVTCNQYNTDPFAPFIMEVFTIRAKQDVSGDDIDHTTGATGTCFLNYFRSLWLKSAEPTGIKTTPLSGATDDAPLPSFTYTESHPNIPFCSVGTEFVPTIFSNFGRKFAVVKRQKYYFQNIGDYFEFKFGKKMFTRLTEGYWYDKFISKKYTTIYLFKFYAATYQAGGGTAARFNFEVEKHASWSKEGDTIDATAVV